MYKVLSQGQSHKEPDTSLRHSILSVLTESWLHTAASASKFLADDIVACMRESRALGAGTRRATNDALTAVCRCHQNV